VLTPWRPPLRDGICAPRRLYSKDYFLKEMPPETVPEIRRTSLISTVLNLKRMGIDDVLHFDYMDPPEPERLVDALKVRGAARA